MATDTYYNECVKHDFINSTDQPIESVRRDECGNIVAINGVNKLRREDTNSTFHMFEGVHYDVITI